MKPRIRQFGALFVPLGMMAILCAAIVAGNRPARPEGRYGYPSPPWRERKGYVIAQPSHYTPWVCEHLTKVKLEASQAERANDFKADDDVPIEFRSTLGDYAGAGYDRGHLSPAADNAFSEAAESESFLLSNMMPQTPELNRGPWAQLEKHVRELVTDGNTIVVIFTGPAFLPNENGRIEIETIGAHCVWRPTHCYKTCLVDRGGAIAVYAWLAPNTAKPGTFNSWRVSVDEIETAVGLDFFAGLPDKQEDELEAARP